MKQNTLSSSPNSGNTFVSGIPKRSIKFRFWLGHTKKMTYEHTLIEISNAHWDFTEDIIPLQFTGMLDKLGNEIYEGDIVQTIGDNGEHLSKFKIYYGDCQFMKLREDGDSYGLQSNQKWLQIIGNVFENPELLG